MIGGRVWRWALLLAGLSLLTLSQARAAFECLPGPVRGGLADWMGRSAWEEERRRGVVSFSLVRPATVDGLIGAHAAACVRAREASLALESYRLALEDIYVESAWGIWAGLGPVRTGIRRWGVRWDEEERGGWSVSIAARTRWRRWRADLGMQDQRLGGDREAAPSPRRGLGISWRARADVELEVDLHESDRRGATCGLRWSPVRGLVLLEGIRLPEDGLQSGVEIELKALTCGIWIAPVSALGSRSGISVAIRFAGAPAR